MSVELGENLRVLRKMKTDYTHTQVAQLLNIERSTYSRYELGVSEPPVSIILKLCEIYSVSCDELLRPRFAERKRYLDVSGLSDRQIRLLAELIQTMKPHNH